MGSKVMNELNLFNEIIKKRKEKNLKIVNQQKKKHFVEKYILRTKEEYVSEFHIESEDEIKITPSLNKKQKEKENLLKTSSMQKLICSIHI